MGCNTSSFFAVLDIFCFFTGFAILTDGFSFLDHGGSFVSFFVFELAVSLFDVFFFVADSGFFIFVTDFDAASFVLP
jgi:hypothetical protein